MPPTPVSITASPTLELSEPAMGAAAAGWVTHCTPPTGIHTQDAEESAAAHFIFFEQINFPPQPSSVKVSVCPDIRDGKSKYPSLQVLLVSPTLTAVPRGTPEAWPCSQNPELPSSTNPQRQPPLRSGVPPASLPPPAPSLSSSPRPACCLSSLNTGKCDLGRVLPSFNHP